MSESVSTPVADVSVDAPAPVSPAPNTQQAISISDAARMLRSARPAPQAQAPMGDGAAPAGREPPAAEEAERGTPAEAPPKRASGVEAMERALGLKPGEAPSESAPEAETGTPVAPAFEFEGRRLSEAELRRELNLAKDYTFKTQQLAQQQRELQEAHALLAQFLPTIQPEIQRMQQQFQQTQPPDPMLKQTNPQAYAEQMNAFYESWAHNQRYEQMQRMQNQARDAAVAKALEEGNRYLAEKYSFWSDPQQRGEVQQHIRRWATQDMGYSEAELDGLTNPKYLETLMKAMAYDMQMKSMPRTAAPSPVVRAAPPRGSAPPPRPAEQVSAAAEAFAAKPSWQNGAALLTAQQVAARRSGNGHTNW
jgi:hypothetical protein